MKNFVLLLALIIQGLLTTTNLSAGDPTKLFTPANGTSYTAGSKMVMEWRHSTNHFGKRVQRFAQLANEIMSANFSEGLVTIIDQMVDIPTNPSLLSKFEWEIPANIKPGNYTLSFLESSSDDIPGINWNGVKVAILKVNSLGGPLVSLRRDGANKEFDITGATIGSFGVLQTSRDFRDWYNIGSPYLITNSSFSYSTTTSGFEIPLYYRFLEKTKEEMPSAKPASFYLNRVMYGTIELRATVSPGYRYWLDWTEDFKTWHRDRPVISYGFNDWVAIGLSWPDGKLPSPQRFFRIVPD